MRLYTDLAPTDPLMGELCTIACHDNRFDICPVSFILHNPSPKTSFFTMMIEQGVSSPSSNVSKHNQDVSNAFYGEDHNADNNVNFHDNDRIG